MKAAIFHAFAIAAMAATAFAQPSMTTETSYNDWSDPSGWALAAESQTGSNGNENSPWPDFDLIDQDWNGDSGYMTWDQDTSNGFNSGTVKVDFVADLSSGTATLTITSSTGQSNTAYYSGLSGTIKNVMIRAAAETSGYSGWDNALIDFYKSGVCRETWASSSVATVDTAADGYGAEEQTTTVTPSQSDDDKIEFLGEFEFSTSEQCPGPDDLYNQIFVMTN